MPGTLLKYFMSEAAKKKKDLHINKIQLNNAYVMAAHHQTLLA